MAVDIGMVMVPVVEQLPAGFDVLRRNARAEGHRNMDRLAEDWVERCSAVRRGGRGAAGRVGRR